MSLGYCQVSTVSLDPSANDRQLIDSGLPSMTAQPSVFIVTDDSYLDIRDGLSYEVTTTGLSSSDEPFLVNIFYIG